MQGQALVTERGTNGVASLRGSASEASDSAMKLIGKSGLSSAARPILAQYSTWPAIVRCSILASERAWSYNVWSMRMDVDVLMMALLQIKNVSQIFYHKSSKTFTRIPLMQKHPDAL